MGGGQPPLDLLGPDGEVRPGLVPWVALLAALATGCTSPSDRSGQEPQVSTPGSSTSAPASPSAATSSPTPGPPTADPPPPAPPERGCYRLTLAQAAQPTTAEEPVPCTVRHSSQTFHVGLFRNVVQGHAVAVDSAHVQQQIEAACDRELRRFLGGSVQDRRLSRLAGVWFAPTLEQADLGARWFRCDVIALAGRDRLALLPRPRRLAGLLDGERRAAPYALCGTAAPGAEGFERVICARRHRWRAIATIALPDRGRYPGVARVRAAGDAPCRRRARAQAEDPFTFAYGWEWPTREQWRAGRHYGFCWAPDRPG